MILNRAGTRLYVACDNSDSVAMIDAASDTLLTQFPVTAPRAVFSNPSGFRGSNPNSLALSPDERTLYVTDGGVNAVAVVGLTEVSGSVAGLIPTGWYPNAVSLSGDGDRLYIVNGKSPAGPNPQGCHDTPTNLPADLARCRSPNQYDLQLTRAGLLSLPEPTTRELKTLTEQVARNDHFRAIGARDKLVTETLHVKIHHVIYIVKENRSYDQVLGDLERGNGDPSLAMLPQAISPNHHQLARQFVTLDNFYDSGEVSGDGWNWSTAARATDSTEKTVAIQYAGHGLDYAYEGTNRNVNVGIASAAARRAANPYTPNDDDLLPGTADVSAPDGPGDSGDEAGTGYLWNDALRAKLTVRNYGFFIDLVRYSVPPNVPGYLPLLHDPHAIGMTVAYAAKTALTPVTDPYFRGFDQAFPDYWRYKEWEREFDAYDRDGNLPALELVRLAHDHFGDFGKAVDGINTVETQMGDNDYAVGLLVEKVAHSRYKNDTLIFVLEDDAQDGPDHMDAHRSVAFIAGPYVRQNALVTTRYTTVHMLRTIEDVLGIEPLGVNDSSVGPMTAIFETTLRPWNYTAIVPAALRTTALPVPAAAASAPPNSAGVILHHDAAYWQQQSQGMDFSAEDRLNAPWFNRILWQGLMGEAAPYPQTRDGHDFRRNRKRLFEHSANLPASTSPR
jgi:DNA-binding beta-propeller fold protein YncE